MKIAVCDDQPNQIAEVKRIWQMCVDDNFYYELSEFRCAEDLLQAYKNGMTYDLLVLDIEMGAISGMEAAKKIRSVDKKCKIIFISAFDQYMRDAFDVSAIHYLDKPIDAEKLTMVFHRCIKEYREQCYPMIFLVYKKYHGNDGAPVQEERVKVDSSDILYFESYNRLINVNLVSGEMIQTKGKISELEQELRSRNFIRIHKSYLINVRYIKKITTKTVTIGKNGQEVTLDVSRKQKELLEKVFMEYKLGVYKTC